MKDSLKDLAAIIDGLAAKAGVTGTKALEGDKDRQDYAQTKL